jgi:hypothetical protein
VRGAAALNPLVDGFEIQRCGHDYRISAALLIVDTRELCVYEVMPGAHGRWSPDRLWGFSPRYITRCNATLTVTARSHRKSGLTLLTHECELVDPPSAVLRDVNVAS